MAEISTSTVPGIRSNDPNYEGDPVAAIQMIFCEGD